MQESEYVEHITRNKLFSVDVRFAQWNVVRLSLGEAVQPSIEWIPHFHLVLRLRIRGAIPQAPPIRLHLFTCSSFKFMIVGTVALQVVQPVA
jgi:hypothetical protein